MVISIKYIVIQKQNTNNTNNIQIICRFKN